MAAKFICLRQCAQTISMRRKMKLPKVSIQKILYATDLTKGAADVFAYAIHLANTFNASITILHVLYDNLNVESFAAFHIGHKEWVNIKKKIHDKVRNALIDKKRENIAIEEVLYQFSEKAKAAHSALPFITDEIVVRRGNPADVILEQVEERNCDAIVMGIREQGLLSEALIGSTTRRVLRRTRKPVFVVPLAASA